MRPKATHIISMSGGKDSLATRLVAIEKGIEHIAVFADTGNEHQVTMDYLDYLEEATGPIFRVKADFSVRMAKKAEFIKTKWPGKHGVSQEFADSAANLLVPTGSPFLDLAIYKSRFPSTKARFCSVELKREILTDFSNSKQQDGERVYSWQGVRADESLARMHLPQWQREDKYFIVVRPILGWTAERTFTMAKRHGIKPNPLYSMGFKRVGCMPCIHCGKDEMFQIQARFPEVIDRIREWERMVAQATPWQCATFFSSDTIPGEGYSRAHIDAVVRWSKTHYGGKRIGFGLTKPETTECSSIYGLCE